MASLDKEIKVLMLKGERGYSSYQEAVENELFSGTLEEWINSFATPENYITRGEFQKVTQAQYDELKANGQLVTNCYYLIIDDTTYEDIEENINDLKSKTNNLENDFGQLNTTVEEVKGDINNLDEKVENLEAVINDLDIPVDVPVNNKTIDISSYGAGLYLVAFSKTTSLYNEYFTEIISIINSPNVQLPTDYNMSRKIVYIGTVGTVSLEILGFYRTDITSGSIEFTDTSIDYNFAYCKRLLKY